MATLPRAVALAVAVTAPVAALTTLAIQRLVPPRRRVMLVADYGIRNVPERPPLWRSQTPPPEAGAAALAAVDPVPPQDPHAPPTPPYGSRKVG